MSNTLDDVHTTDAEYALLSIEEEGAYTYFTEYVERKTELTFDSDGSKLIPKVEREVLKIAFDNAKKYYHTAKTYSDEVVDILGKYV